MWYKKKDSFGGVIANGNNKNGDVFGGVYDRGSIKEKTTNY